MKWRHKKYLGIAMMLTPLLAVIITMITILGWPAVWFFLTIFLTLAWIITSINLMTSNEYDD